VLGAFNLTRFVVAGMQRAGHGSNSVYGIHGVVDRSSRAAKSAYLCTVHSLAPGPAPAGIRMSGIAPGWIETPMLHAALDGDPSGRTAFSAAHPAGRFGHPQDT
jgi:gluconate 5-dehydrogenase